MGHLYYLKLFVLSLTGNVSNADLERLCAECEKEHNRFLNAILKNQWRFTPAAQIAACLRMYGSWIHNNKFLPEKQRYNDLWLVYFDLMRNKPYDLEVEKILIKNMDHKEKGWQILSHSLSEAGETAMVEQYGAEDGFYDYVKRFSLAEKALDKLIDKSLEQKEFRILICDLCSHYCALTDDMCLSILQAKNLGGKIYQACFYRYDMLNAPSLTVVKAMLQMTYAESYLTELLTHSWLENGKAEVLRQYPKLKNKILAAEICHEACLLNEHERSYMYSKEYEEQKWELFVNDNYPWHSKNRLPDGSYSMLMLCTQYCLYEKTSTLQAVLNYCMFYGGRLKEYVPQLQKVLPEKRNKR